MANDEDAAVQAGSKPVAAWEPPGEVDDYTILRPLGQGGMGRVYLAEDVILARKVAIKFVATRPPDAATRQRFLREARAAARIHHPNVAAIYRAGEHAGIPYLVSELVRGDTLESAPKPMPWIEALEIGTQLARGLSAAHREGVLHRDIKPGNVLRTIGGDVRLIDFGLATLVAPAETSGRPDKQTRAAPRSSRSRDVSGANDMTPETSDIRQRDRPPEGTLDFIAPELWFGEPATRRSDLYAFGVLLYELCAGRTPFDDVEPEEVPETCIRRDAPPLLSLAPRVDARLAALVDRCLRREPHERFASMDDVLAALEAIRRRATRAPSPSGNPYRGLRPFQAEHRALFFGRSAEIAAVLDRLRAESFLLVTGDSGAGKSSLCRAGVLPAILDGALGDGRTWTACTVVPGRTPRAALVASVARALQVDAAALSARVDEDPAAIAREIAKRAGGGRGLMVLLDQAEELVTIADPEEARGVIAALAAIAGGAPGVRVLGTIRADFLARFAALPPVVEDLARTLYFLRPMSADRLREVIVGPAEIQGARFESEETIAELVETAAGAQGGLPLLQFVLAKLWELRRPDGEIPASALRALGGARGALARHADDVLGTMDRAGRLAVQRLLSRMVTIEGTRARRTLEQLGADKEPAKSALDALVNGRIVVALESPEGPAFEIAHEVLVVEWQTLARWLEESRELRRARERLTQAASEWHERGRRPHSLWGAVDLAEAEQLAGDDFSERERQFLSASRVRAKRARIARWTMIAMLPALAIGAFTAAKISQRYTLAAQVAERLAAAEVAGRSARTAREEADRLRREAFSAYDALDRRRGEEAWARARERHLEAERGHATTSRELEGALALDATREDVRARLADELLARADLADDAGEPDVRDEQIARLALYDTDGSRRARWEAPVRLDVETEPPGAEVQIEPQLVETGRVRAGKTVRLGTTPLTGISQPQGSFVLVLTSAEGVDVRYPFVARRGADVRIRVDLRPAAKAPRGFTYVPEGAAIFGTSADEGARIGFFDTVPAHAVLVGGFYIARHETTWADWIAFLRALPEAERRARSLEAGPRNAVRVRELPDGDWEVFLQPDDRAFTARIGGTIVDPRRSSRAERALARLPVLGVSFEDVKAYAAWLGATGRAPGARLCTEREWERAARGADGRDYPHGWVIAPDDLDYDATYAKAAIGPDEVGAHPASRSPFGVDDMSGNANEWAVSSLDADQLVIRGGSFFHDQKTAQLANRTVSSAALRDGTVGLRLCADLPR